MDNLIKKIAIQEEILDFEIINNKYGWQIEDRLKYLNEEPIVQKNNELDIDTILNFDLHTEKGDLIEVVLSEMRIHTNMFQSELNKQKKAPEKEID